MKRYNKETSFQSSIAGSHYCKAGDYIRDLPLSTHFDLILEPGNPHDCQATRIEHKGKKLGYVPSNQNGPIHRLLRVGWDVSCWLISNRFVMYCWKTPKKGEIKELEEFLF